MLKKKERKVGIVAYSSLWGETSKEEGLKGIPSVESKYYTSYSKLSEVKIVTIGMASPLRILQWAEKTLPNGRIYGEVTNANTLHHKTFKPQKGGLFCERIFGPLKDFECACGKVDKSVKQESGLPLNKGTGPNQANSLTSNRKFCPDCDVEYTWSVIRRYQLGYIKLNSPVLHIWFLKGTPSYLSILLDIKKRHLQNLAYCSETITLENAFSQQFLAKSLSLDSPSKIYSSWKNVLKKVTLDNPSNTLLNEGKFDSFGAQDNFKNLSEKQQIQEYQRLKRFSRKVSLGKKPDFVQSLKSDPLSYQDARNQSENNKVLPVLSEKLNSMRNGSSNKQISLSQKQSLLKLISALQFSFYYDSLSLKQNVLFGNKLNENSFLDALQTSEILTHVNSSISDNYSPSLTETVKTFKNRDSQSTMNNKPLSSRFSQNQNSNFYLTESFMTFNKLLKRLPVDLYIVSSLESMLHKKVLTLLVYKLWQSIYQKAYLKAMMNSTKLVTKSNANLMNLGFTFTKEFSSINKMPLTETIEQNFSKKNFLKSENQKMFIEEIENFKVYTYQKSADSLNEMLQTTKESFKNWMFEKVSTLNEPIYSVQFTSNISQNNASILKLMSAQLEASLNISLNGNNFENSETLGLKNNFLRNFSKKNFVVSKGSKTKLSTVSTNTKMSRAVNTNLNTTEHFSSEKVHNEIFKENFLGLATIDFFIKKISTSFMRPLLIILFLEQMKKTVLKERTQENFSEEKFNKVNDLQTELLNTLPWFKFDKKFFEQTFSNEKLNGHLTDLTRDIPASLNSYLESVSFTNFNVLRKGKQIVKVGIHNKKNFSKNFKAKMSNLVNPIYTLSHRERWSTTKDWDFFQFYNTVPSDYTDSPIPYYKSRVFSFTEKSSFDFLNFSTTSGLAVGKDPQGAYANKGTLSNSNFSNSSDLDSILSPAFFSGPGLVQQLLNEFNFAEIKKLDKQNRLLLYQLNQSIFKLKKQSELYAYEKTTQKELKELCKKRDLLIRRTKLVRKFFRKDSDPSSMILTVLPVLPPDLRPIVKMGNQIAASDLNRLYQRVIYRNERLKKFLKDPATSQSYEMKYAQRLLQEAVDNLIQNGKSGNNSEKDNKNRPLKSLSDILKGKQGRFRQFLLGKRVDYSGRSVIVVGPKLQLHECGLPFEMAIELYLPFLLKLILNKNYAKTVIGAKSLIKKNTALAHELLREIMQVSPVLLNRAPTLHRLGIQAFVPKLVEGRAILLHPLVCSAFNADFDGDQMAVHVPITVEARAEAWKLMLSRNNILSTATGEPLAIPSQDMVLGCYYLTTLPNKMKFASVKQSQPTVADFNTGKQLDKGVSESLLTLPMAFGPTSNISLLYFKNFEDVMTAYNQQKISVHSLVWVQWNNSIENGADQEEPIEIRLSEYGHWQEITSNYHRFFSSTNQLINQYMLTTPGRILFNLILQNINP